MDVAAQVEAIRRRVETTQRDAAPARVVVTQQDYAADIDDVWDALTNAERLPRWFLPISGELQVGGRYQFEGNAGGQVLSCDRPRRAEVTWEFGGGISWVELRLSSVDGGTRLELRHTAPVDPHWEEYGPGAVGVGWDLSLMGLAQHLAGAPDVDPVEAEAFSTSPDGRDFVAASSSGWCAAAIADGDDPEAARAAAQRTAAFYTGMS